jgi:hypothetical protein
MSLRQNSVVLTLVSTATLTLAAYLSQSVSPRLEQVEKQGKARASQRVVLGIKDSLNAFRLVTFGQAPIIVDGLLIRFLVSGAENIQLLPGQHSLGFRDLDLATQLDPRFYELYSQGVNALAVLQSDGVGAARLVERGLEFQKNELNGQSKQFKNIFWPNEWQLPFLGIYVYLFELQDLPKAARLITEAAQIPGVPAFVQWMADRLAKPNGLLEVGIRVLGFQLETTRDPEIRSRLEKMRQQLAIRLELKILNEDYQGSTKRLKPRDFLLARGFFRDRLGGEIYWDDRKGEFGTTTSLEKSFGVE